jgi:ubiquinone/menaquinone biosynthesis C-methylase UbiE
MIEVFRQIPLYRYIMLCNETTLDKTVLDCGAGGDCPPLSLFSEYGYVTHGIEFSRSQLEDANAYARRKNQNLNMEQGDMRKLKFEDESFSFVYSYNSVFHMHKEDVKVSIDEMKRVLKKDGLIFVNFLTTKDFRCGLGVDFGNHQYEQMEDGMPIIHSYYEEDEPDVYFEDMQILYKESRVLERIFEGEIIRQGFVDYILQKI